MEPLSTQNSDFPSLSQPEVSHTEANHTEANHTEQIGMALDDVRPRSGSDSSDCVQDKTTSMPLASKRIGLRITVAIAALIPLSLLIIAGNLNPAEKGLGTHQQLGLPPCSLRVLAGIRCPACGMTTSWSYFARGNWLASMNTNAGGFLLALLSIAMILIAAQIVRHGRLPSPRVQTWLTLAGVGVLVVTLLDWTIRLQS